MIWLALLLLLVATVWFVATSRTPGKPLFQEPFPGCVSLVLLALIALFFLAGILLGPINQQHHAWESAAMQTCRTLGLAMWQYANDNDGEYPDGASSTEVFQKLEDGNYISDPAIFFVPLPGKVTAKRGERLKPENIAYDVTSGVDAKSSDDLPIVFLTGFRMDYRPDGSAVSLVRPFPSWKAKWLSWAWSGRDEGAGTFDGLPVAYHSNNAFFRVRARDLGPNGMGVVPHVLAPDFNPQGQTYRQLTPTGVLK